MNYKISKNLSQLNNSLQKEIYNFFALMNLGLNKNPTEGGIYKCTYIKDPRYVYIGRTICFSERWNTHERQLKNNTHCGNFQHFFNKNKCSIEDFEWSVLEYLNTDNINIMQAHEKIWIQKYENDSNYILLNTIKYNKGD